MRLSGLVALFVGKPVHPIGADGRMALSDHLRELRARILKIAVVIVVGLAVSLIFYNHLFDVVAGPYRDAAEKINEGLPPGEQRTIDTIDGAGGGLLLYLKLGALASIVLTSPVWLYQIWAFILPGLHSHERRWTRVFASVAGPLFLVGVWLGYVTLPKGLEVLIGFTPDGLTNLIEFNDYLTFFSRTLLVFGIAFEIPVFVVLLNLVGVVKGRSLGAHRPWIIVGVFVFAAVATPSADPFTMTFMAVPMVLLFFVSEIIARFNDRRRARRNPYRDLSPDELSPL
ncbi:twin-arginine translocase subunit TatC [Nocardioides sp. SYSU D00038]|uniref:twin-arginine translocase subunit TatC n=1 Tax=Nocardioides sp. SYSU D00038 TaxID=2812554 RepID=UPI001967A9C9|nr:twin-arginine translocase subunit TatC [Nocardioides sp. SYSU D00038]